MNDEISILSRQVADRENGVDDLAEKGRVIKSKSISLEKEVTETVSKHIATYTTDSPKSLCPVCNNGLEIRENEISPPASFEEKKYEFFIESTHSEHACAECNSNGQQACKCDWTGEEDCERCDGTGHDEDGKMCGYCGYNDCHHGKVVCSMCNGRGGITCDRCRGESTLHIFKKEVIEFKTQKNSKKPRSPHGVRISGENIPWMQTESELIQADSGDSLDIFPDRAQLQDYRREGKRITDKKGIHSEMPIREIDSSSKELLRVRFSKSKADAKEIKYEYGDEEYWVVVVNDQSEQNLYIFDDYPKSGIKDRVIDTIKRFF